MEIGGDKVTRLFPFFFYHHDGDFSEVFNAADKSSDFKSLVFPVEGKRDLLIGRVEGWESGDLSSFPIDEERRIGSELRDHMVPTLSAESSQGFPPIPAISQEVDFTGNREPQTLNHLFNQLDFGPKRATSLSAFGMIEFGPEGQEEILIEESQEDPLVAEDMRFLSPLFMPATSGHLFACLLGNGVIHDKKEDRMVFDP